MEIIQKKYPNLKYSKINEINKKMKYITIRKYKNQQFIFLDECIHYGNVITFIRKQCFIINQNEMKFDECVINMTIDVDKSYFNNVELYKIES